MSKHRGVSYCLLFILAAVLLTLPCVAGAAPGTGAAPADNRAGEAAAARAATVPSQVWVPAAPAGISADTVAEIEAASANTAYAILDSSAGGRMIKTTNYGDSWATTDFPSAIAWTCQLSVVNDQVVWIGSVHTPGGGVAVTTNGGGDWGYNGAQAYMYAIEATSSGQAWIGGHFPGEPGGFIYGTSNGGTKWDLVVGIGHGSCMDIESSSATNAWAVGGGDYHGLIWHYDGSAWTNQTPTSPYPAELNGCWAVDNNTAWAVGGNQILRTTNGGASWDTFTAPTNVGGLSDVTALDASTAIAVGNNGAIIRTTDGGTTWERMYSIVGQHLKSVYAYDATHAYAVGAAGTVLRLVDHNTDAGTGVTAALPNGDTATFSSVTSAGNTIETGASAPSQPMASYITVRDCVDISTSATYTGSIQVTMPYPEANLSGFPEAGLHMLHWHNGAWEDITTSIDTVNNTVTGTCDSLSEFMLVYPLPKVTGITPSIGARGTTVHLEVTGNGFWGTPHVKLSPLDEGPDIVATNAVCQSLDRITCDVSIPADAPLGLYTASVVNQDDIDYPSVLWGSFTVVESLPAPTVTGITPASGTQGATVTVTNLAGTGFTGTPTVQLRKSGQTSITATDVSVESATKITCSLALPAAAATGAWDVVVTNQDSQTGTLAGGFTVNAAVTAPAITSLSSTSGRVGAVVTVTGTGFGATRGTSYVSFGSAKAIRYTAWSDTQVSCRVPAAAAGRLDVTLTTGSGTSNAVSFKVTPRLTKVAPKAGKVRAKVVLTGSGFGAKRGTSYVRFGGKKVTKYVSWSATRIVCKVPKAGKGSRPVTVSTPGGTSNRIKFRIR